MHSSKVPHRLYSSILKANKNLAGKVLQSYNCSVTTNHDSKKRGLEGIELQVCIEHCEHLHELSVCIEEFKRAGGCSSVVRALTAAGQGSLVCVIHSNC